MGERFTATLVANVARTLSHATSNYLENFIDISIPEVLDEIFYHFETLPMNSTSATS
jgi:hypothetical protein